MGGTLSIGYSVEHRKIALITWYVGVDCTPTGPRQMIQEGLALRGTNCTIVAV